MLQVPHQVMYASLALGCALLATVTDLRERKIPNALNGTAAAAGMLLHAAWDGVHGFEASVEGGLVAGGLFLLLHLIGGVGAGDVKLMFAIGALHSLVSLPSVLIGIVLSGGTLAMVFCLSGGRLRQSLAQIGVFLGCLKRGRLQRTFAGSSCEHGSLSLPYALPIALGCFFDLAGRMP